MEREVWILLTPYFVALVISPFLSCLWFSDFIVGKKITIKRHLVPQETCVHPCTAHNMITHKTGL